MSNGSDPRSWESNPNFEPGAPAGNWQGNGGGGMSGGGYTPGGYQRQTGQTWAPATQGATGAQINDPSVDPNAYQYGGYAGGAAARQNQLAQQNAQQQAVQGAQIQNPYDQRDQSQVQNTLGTLSNYYAGQLNGTGPSLAAQQARSAMDQSIQAQMAAANSARGSLAGVSAQMGAASNAAAAQQAAAQQSVQGRIAEEYNAAQGMQGVGQLGLSEQGLNAQTAYQQAALQQQQQGINAQAGLGYAGLENQVGAEQLQAQMGGQAQMSGNYLAASGMGMNQSQFNTQQQNALLAGGLGAGLGLVAAFADADFEEPSVVGHPSTPGRATLGPRGRNVYADMGMGHPAHITLREEHSTDGRPFLAIADQNTGAIGRVAVEPLTHRDRAQVMAPHGAGPLLAPMSQRAHAVANDAQMRGPGVWADMDMHGQHSMHADENLVPVPAYIRNPQIQLGLGANPNPEYGTPGPDTLFHGGYLQPPPVDAPAPYMRPSHAEPMSSPAGTATVDRPPPKDVIDPSKGVGLPRPKPTAGEQPGAQVPMIPQTVGGGPVRTGYQLAAPKPLVGQMVAAQGQEQLGVEAQGLAAQHAAKAAQIAADEKAGMLREQGEETRKAAEAHDAEIKSQLDKMETLSQDVAKQKIDPDAWWAKQGTVSKVRWALVRGLSGFLAGWRGGPDRGAEEMNAHIQADLEAQKQEIEAKKGRVADMRGILAETYRRYGNMDQAMAAAHALSLQQVDAEAAAHAAGSQSEQAKADYQVMGAKLKQEQVKALLPLYKPVQTGGAAKNPDAEAYAHYKLGGGTDSYADFLLKTRGGIAGGLGFEPKGGASGKPNPKGQAILSSLETPTHGEDWYDRVAPNFARSSESLRNEATLAAQARAYAAAMGRPPPLTMSNDEVVAKIIGRPDDANVAAFQKRARAAGIDMSNAATGGGAPSESEAEQ